MIDDAFIFLVGFGLLLWLSLRAWWVARTKDKPDSHEKRSNSM